MRVAQVLPNIFLQRSSFRNNHEYDYSGYRYPVSSDSFCGKTYSSNERNAVTSLIRFGVTCLCCGKKMIDPADISRMHSQRWFKGDSHTILANLKKYEDVMKPLEKRVYNLLKKLQKVYPNKNLPQLLETKKHDIEAKLIEKQSKIFSKIYDYCLKHLPESKLEELDDIFKDSYDEIYGRKKNTTFSRKKFIGLTYKFSRKLPLKHQEHLMNLAEKLPSSQDMYEAFIVKYSRKSNYDIALRLIEKSVGTIEHIKPKAEGGSNHISNYALECAGDNWERSDSPMFEQIKKHPDMPENAQKQINQIIELVNKGESGVNKSYVISLKEALYRASGGIIDLDIRNLNRNIPDKEIY